MSSTSNILKIRSLLLLAIFLFLKMGIAHSMTHAFSHDDVAECNDCFLILNSNEKNHFDYCTESFEATIIVTQPVHKPVAILYKKPFVTLYFYTTLYNRPPPSVS